MSQLGLLTRIRRYLKDRYQTEVVRDSRSHSLHLEALEPRLLLSGTVEGSVWYDLDKNGERASDEPGFVDIQVYIDFNRNNQHDDGEPSTFTTGDNPITSDIDESGQYSFTNVPTGEHVVSIDPPDGFDWPPELLSIDAGSGSYNQILPITQFNFDTPSDIDISDDGRFLYILDVDADKLVVFSRDAANGSLQSVQTFSSGDDGLNNFNPAQRLELSRDGRFLFVSQIGSTIHTFARNAETGHISYLNSISAQSQSDPVNLISTIRSMTVTHDNQYLLVTGDEYEGLVSFTINQQTGALSYNHHFQDTSVMNQPVFNDISPDDRFVYVSSSISDTITVFERNLQTGQLSLTQTLHRRNPGLSGLNDVYRITLSPDGRFAYTGSLSAVIAFERNQETGHLTKIQNFFDSSSVPLDVINTIAISQDGRTLVVAAWRSDTVTTFLRDPETGLLTPSVVHESYDVPGLDLDMVRVLMISPDDNHLYVLSTNNPNIMTFARDLNFGVPVSVSSGQTTNNANIGLISPDDYYDYPSNNGFQSAFDLSAHANTPLSDIRGLAESYDEDWYKITVPADNLVLKVELTSDNADDLNLELYDFEAEPIHVISQNIESGKFIFTDAKPRSYYIRVVGDVEGAIYDLEWNTVAQPTTSGQIFHDLNHDGIPNSNEPYLAGITVFADLNLNHILDEDEPFTVTLEDNPLTDDINETGTYEFSIPTGRQYITPLPPTGWKTAYPDPFVQRGHGELTLIDSESSQSNTPLVGLKMITQSSDSVYLYATNPQSNSISVFKRDPLTGTTEPVQTIDHSTVPDLTGASYITLSPDDHFAYVSAFDDNALVIFLRDSNNGELSYASSITNNDINLTKLEEPGVSIITDDGAYLYLANDKSDTIIAFARDQNDGTLSFIAEYTDNTQGIMGIDGIRDLTISPDQNHLYTVGDSSDSIAVFTMNPQFGTLEFVQIIENSTNGVTGLDGVSSITLSHDGLFAYTTSPDEDAITLFDRNPADGTLTFNSIYQNNNLGVKNIEGIVDLVLSPDGQDLYAAGSLSDTIAHFKRDLETGTLTYFGSADNNMSTVNLLNGVQSLLLSNDTQDLYAGASISGKLTAWSRYYASQVYEVSLSIDDIENDLLFGLRQPADVNRNGNANAEDIDLIYNVLPFGVYFASFDVNEDSELNHGDIDSAVREMFGSEYGDANLDRVVNLEDLALLATNFGQSNKGWAQGDYTGDKTVDLEDLALLAEYFGTDHRSADMTGGQGAVQEPESDNFDLLEAASHSHANESFWISESENHNAETADTSESNWAHIHNLLDENNDSLM